MDFVIPAAPDDLLQSNTGGALAVKHLTELSAVGADEIHAFAEGAVYDICNNDALCITEQAVFDPVFSLARGFKLLQSIARRRLIDGLCSNLSVLCASATALVQSQPEDRQQHDLLLACHRSALKAYVFLLHWLVQQMEQEAKAEADTSAASASASARGGGKARKKAAADRNLGTWDWSLQRERIVRAAGGVADLDLQKLFSPAPVDDALVQRWVHLALLALDSASGAKSKDVRDAASRVLGYAAMKLGQLEAIAASLVDGLNKSEALAAAAAEVAQLACARFGDDRLAVELLRHVTAVDPGEYERQTAHNDTAGVRNVAVFVVDLAERMAKTVAMHMALLIPHLGGKAYPMRSAIVTAAGHLLVHAFSDAAEHAPGGAAGAQSQGNWLRAKQALLDLLTQRVRDQSAYTRARSLHTWALLADKCALPLGHWMLVTQLATGRLEDKAAIVRKAALQLLAALMHSNPFAPTLAHPAFEASLLEYQVKLQEVCPEEETEPADGARDHGDEARWAEGEVPVDDRTGNAAHAEDASQMETDEQAGDSSTHQPSPGSSLQTQPSQNHSETQADSTQRQTHRGENVEQLRHLVASLRVGTDFAKAMSHALGALGNLLGSATLSDVQETLSLVISCRQFQVTGVETLLRRMLLLVFAREQGVRDALVDAFCQLYVQELPAAAVASNLVDLASGASLGELGALEDLMTQLMKRDKPLLSQQVLEQLWTLPPASQATPQQLPDHQRTRARFAVISMAAAWQPSVVADNLSELLELGFGSDADPLVTRYACCALRHLGSPVGTGLLSQQQLHPAIVALTQVLLDACMPPQGWFSAAEAAVGALYALDAAPQDVCGAIICTLADRALSGPRDRTGEARALDLARLLFTVGHVALSQLVHIEAAASATRQKRAAADKAALEAHSQALASGQGEEGEDIAAQLGLGSVASDLELDALKDACEAQIAAADGLLGRFAPLVACLCHHSSIRGVHEHLRAAALLALTKLMAVSSDFCEANLQLLFTLLHTRGVEASIRSNLVIALGDLAVRWPNVLEPWTAHMYQPLTDSDPGVRKNAVMVLSHLILNDMMKVKGHIARLALCLRDAEPRVADLATLFFHELAGKATKGSNPIYNLLPDMLSTLSAEPGLAGPDFQGIMKTLLGYIGKERHADALVDKLLPRFEGPGPLSRNLAFCLSQLSFTEKGVRKVVELFKLYQAALGDDEVLEVFKAMLAKARKLPKQSAELKGDLVSYEERLLEAAAAAEKAADEAAVEEQEEAAAEARGETQGANEEDVPQQEGAEAEASKEGDEAAGMEIDGEAEGAAFSRADAGPAGSQAASAQHAAEHADGDIADLSTDSGARVATQLPLTQEPYSEESYSKKQEQATQAYDCAYAADTADARSADQAQDPEPDPEPAASHATMQSGATAAASSENARSSGVSSAAAGLQRMSLQERTNLPEDGSTGAAAVHKSVSGQQSASVGTRRQQKSPRISAGRRNSTRSTRSRVAESSAGSGDASEVSSTQGGSGSSPARKLGGANATASDQGRRSRSSVAAMRNFWENQRPQ